MQEGVRVGKGRGAGKVQVELSSFYFRTLEIAVTVHPQIAVLIINIIAKYLIVLKFKLFLLLGHCTSHLCLTLSAAAAECKTFFSYFSIAFKNDTFTLLPSTATLLTLLIYYHTLLPTFFYISVHFLKTYKT